MKLLNSAKVSANKPAADDHHYRTKNPQQKQQHFL